MSTEEEHKGVIGIATAMLLFAVLAAFAFVTLKGTALMIALLDCARACRQGVRSPFTTPNKWLKSTGLGAMRPNARPYKPFNCNVLEWRNACYVVFVLSNEDRAQRAENTLCARMKQL